jgi:hypothetical protein
MFLTPQATLRIKNAYNSFAVVVVFSLSIYTNLNFYKIPNEVRLFFLLDACKNE